MISQHFLRPLFQVLARRSVDILLIAAALILGACSKKESDRDPVSSSSDRPLTVSSDTAPKESYGLGTKISFTGSGNSKSYRGAGWSQPEVEFTWTEGIRAELKFRGIAAGTPLKLQAILVGFTHAKELSEQDVEVLANEKQIAAWKVGPEKEEYAAIIPADAASLDGVLTLEFRVPKAASPSQFGDSPDKRLLGLRFYEVIINKSS